MSRKSGARKLLYCSFGYTTHDHRFLSAACGAGWRVTVLRFDGGQQDLEDRDIPEGSNWYPWIGQQTGLTEGNRSKFIAELEAVIENVKPDVIQAGPLHDVASIVTSTSTTVPVLATSWGIDLLLHCELSASNRERIVNVFRRSEKLLVDCQTLAEKAAELGCQRGQISVIPWGIDLEAFPFRERTGSTRTVKITSLRSLEPLYDVETLIRALPELKRLRPGTEIEVVIAGGGSMREELRALAEELSVSNIISWVGRITEAEVSALLQNSDIYVSTSPIDGTSISLLQAMATGLLCVVADIPSNHEWIESEMSGLFFGSGDPESLSRVIGGHITSPSPVTKLGEFARRTVSDRANWILNREKYCSLLLAATQKRFDSRSIRND